jgi:hypothetical protein
MRVRVLCTEPVMILSSSVVAVGRRIACPRIVLSWTYLETMERVSDFIDLPH